MTDDVTAADFEFTDKTVYLVYEYRRQHDDRLRLICEDDTDMLTAVIKYCDKFADPSGSLIGPDGDFHAAKPWDEHLETGDWYLTKTHGVGVSHGL